MTSDSIGLYIHIPFCTAKCGYCDFNSYAGHEHMIPSYGQTLLKDARLWTGTMRDGLRETFGFAADAEISLEANPGSLSTEYLRDLRAIGFNRLSVGVQSFDDAELRAL